jgi:hypothetical protein
MNMEGENDAIKITVEWAYIDDKLTKILLVYKHMYWCFEICQDANDENMWRTSLNGNPRLFVIEKEEDIFKVGPRVFIDLSSAKRYIRHATVQMLAPAWKYSYAMYQKEKWTNAGGNLVKTFENGMSLLIEDSENDCSLYFEDLLLKNYPTRNTAVQDAKRQFIYTLVPMLMELHIEHLEDID